MNKPGMAGHTAGNLPRYADRVAAESARIVTMKALATPPAEFAAAPMAPAFGPKVPVVEYEVVAGGTRRRVSTHFRRADVFDALEQRARQVHQRKTGQDDGYVAPFSPGQVAMARTYRDMTERHSAGGLRCISLTGQSAGGGGGEFVDAHIDLGNRLRALHRAIGTRAALVVRRVRPSARGAAKAGLISDRTLVDAVCMRGLDLNSILRAAGWTADGHHRRALRLALSAALDRMLGCSDSGGAK